MKREEIKRALLFNKNTNTISIDAKTSSRILGEEFLSILFSSISLRPYVDQVIRDTK